LKVPRPSYSPRLTLVLFIFVYVIYSLPGITRPWGNDHSGFLTKEKAAFAINYLKFGIWNTGLGQKMDEGGTMDSSLKRYTYYTRHPVGISLLTALSFRLFGVTEWAARLVAMVLNVSILALLFRFFQGYWDQKTALLALFFVVCSPMFFYIRHLLAFELLALLFISAILYLYVTWQEAGRRRDWFLLFGAVSLGTLISDWQTYFLIPGIVAHNIFFARRKQKAILLLLPLACLSFLAYIAHVKWLTGSINGAGAGGEMWGNMLLRMNISDPARSANISVPRWAAFFVRYYFTFYTPLLGVFAILFLAICLMKPVLRKRLTEQEGLLVCCFLAFAGYFAVFSHAYMCCEFMNLFFLPVSGLFGATLIVSTLRFLQRMMGHRARGVAGWIPVAGCAVFFLILSYPTAKSMYSLQSLDLPLNNFFSDHRDNIIVGFDEDASFYQLRPYLQVRTVKRVVTLDGLRAALNEAGGRFGFVILKRGTPVDPELRQYVSAHFSSRRIANSPTEEYDVFDTRSNDR
jgi:hypothetical protein